MKGEYEMANLVSNSLIHTYKSWEVIQHFYDNGTNDFGAYHNRQPLRDENGEIIYASTAAEIDDAIDAFSAWGGPREGAGRPATGRKRQQYYVSDDENIKLRQYLEGLRTSMDYNKMYCTNSDLDKLVRERVAEGWKMFAHEHPENGTIVDVVNDTEPVTENVKFQQKYLYKNGHTLGTCAIYRFWKPSE
jgi:hypothetical protein